LMVENGCLPYTEALKGEPLLQSGELIKASPIPNPESLASKQLMPLWELGKNFLQGNPHFVAVAFTQFRQKSFELVNGDPLLRRMIFFPCILANLPDDYKDYLLINPKLAIPSPADYYASVEGCGSIDFARLGMVVRRPYLILLKTYLWRPGKEMLMASISLRGFDAGVTEHEYLHLEGKDATSFPENILDFTDPKNECWHNRDEAQAMVAREVRDITAGRDVQRYQGWLIHQEGKLIVVDRDGQYLRDF